jgi:hypothetical protein
MKLFVILKNTPAHNGQLLEYKGMTIAENEEEAIKPYGGSSKLDAVAIEEIGDYNISVTKKEPQREDVVIHVCMSQAAFDEGCKIKLPSDLVLRQDQNLVIKQDIVSNESWEKMVKNPEASKYVLIHNGEPNIFIEGTEEAMKGYKIDTTDLD